MRYNVSDHALLNGKSKALVTKNEDQFAEWNTLAELLLGFDDIPLLTGDQAKAAKRYIALQVNWMILMDPDALMLKSVSSGHAGHSKVFRDNNLISPYVRAGVRALTSKWKFRAGLRSLRGAQT